MKHRKKSHTPFTGGSEDGKEKETVPTIIDSVETLEAKMKAMREAQKIFATYTQEQVDKIFFEAAMAANKMRILLRNRQSKKQVVESLKIRLLKPLRSRIYL